MSNPDAQLVRSAMFHELMHRHVDGLPGLDEAHQNTVSYRFRHRGMAGVLGVWRWRGLYDNREELLPLLEEGGRIVDFGGGACSVGFGAEVVDAGDTLHGEYDGVFTSHTLEHCEDARAAMEELLERVKRGGWFVVHVPAYTATHWNAGMVRVNDAIHGKHLWNFCLAEDAERCPKPCVSLKAGRYVGDNSILWVGRKP